MRFALCPFGFAGSTGPQIGEGLKRPHASGKNGLFHSFVSDVFLAVAVVTTIMLIASALSPVFSFARWDNVEYYIPTLVKTHGAWLKGQIPFWNPHQHMGEPLLANGQPAVFYVPYTFAVFVIQSGGWDPGHLMTLIVWMHLTWGLVGFVSALRDLGAGRRDAWVGSIAIMTGGFLSAFSAMWIFIPCVLSWVPWCLKGLRAALAGSRNTSLWLPFGLGAIGAVGYPQLLMHVVLWLGLLSAWLTLAGEYPPRRLLNVSGMILAGIALSSPTWLPMASILSGTDRAGNLNAEFWLARSIHPRELWSLIYPLFNSDNGYLPQLGITLTFFQGAWVIPALVKGLTRGGSKTWVQGTRGWFHACLFAGAIFLLFSLGVHGGVLPLTHGIPIWSSFRWPFKFALCANMSIGLAATLALGGAGRPTRGEALRWGVGVGVWAGFLALGFLAHDTPYGWRHPGALLAWFCGAVTLAALSLPRGLVPGGWLVLLTTLSGAAVLSMAHGQPLCTYSEKVGSFGQERMGLATSDRYLPVGDINVVDYTAPPIQALGHFQSATANGLWSLTGCGTAMIPMRFARLIPTAVNGLLLPDSYQYLLGSHLLKSWNVRYAVVDKRAPSLAGLARARGFRPIRDTGPSVVMEQAGALPRAYFATHVGPGEYHALRRLLIENQGPPTLALLPGPRPFRPIPEGRVIQAIERDNETIISVDAPRGGFLVLAQTHFDDWRATVDGSPRNPLLVNALVMGVWVPPGAKVVRFFIRSQALIWGLMVALAAALALAGWRFLKRSDQNTARVS